MWVWYRGERFLGFQTQAQGPTVQATLRSALAAVGVPHNPSPAGRTDKGVHARMQVVSFRLDPSRAVDEVERALRPRLPPGLGVCALKRAPAGFHAQWRATAKEYRYRLALGPPPPAWEGLVWQPSLEPRLFGARLDPARLAALFSLCVGTRDFFAFHESSSVRRARTLTSAKLLEVAPGVFEARLVGDAFARYQVRYLVGSVALAAAGVLSEEALRAALESAQEISGLKAPAAGLTLWEVHYPPPLDPFAAERKAPPHLPAEPPFF